MKTFEWGVTGLLAIAVLSCSVESGSDETAEVGVLRMELSSTVGDRVYELVDANFRVEGNGSDILLNGDNVELIEYDLAPGSYTITLQDSWRIERTANGLTEEVPAVVTSDNPLAFTITESEITPVVYTFEAGDGVITFGNGQLQVGVEITENNGNGLSCNSSNPCDDGFTCVAGECLGVSGTPCESNDECVGGVCATFYADNDADGFGSESSSVSHCGNTPPGVLWADNDLDCCDSDASANPNYDSGFTSTPTACGGFDFNCDGVETSQIPSGLCSSFATTACPGVTYRPDLDPVPECGELGVGSACAVVDGTCENVRGAEVAQRCY